MYIRRYTHYDHAACLNIFKSNCSHYFDASEQSYLEAWLTAQDNGMLVYESNLSEDFFVLEQEDKVVACGGFYLPRNNLIANMVWGMVHAAFHKQGFGTAMFAYRIEKIKELDTTRAIVLDTSQHTFRFFESFGFEKVKITADAYGEGLHRYDMILK
ncbi:MAG: GNAT family N-acetyltransferase [Flavipsychrobacter sp.]|nr:GNAT family N-acetyltransferase [Flavipsychrobacter sp.]